MATRQQQRTFTAGSSAQLGLTAQQTYAVASAAQAQSYSNQLNPQPLTADTLKQAIAKVKAQLQKPEAVLHLGQVWQIRGWPCELEITSLSSSAFVRCRCLTHGPYTKCPSACGSAGDYTRASFLAENGATLLRAEPEPEKPILVICLYDWWRVEGFDYPVYVVGFDDSGKNIMVNDLEHPGETSVISRYRFVELVKKKKKKPTPPSHEWTIERGNLVFCGRCGDDGADCDVGVCEPVPEETVKERIESTIAVVMYNRGYSGRWHNQPMAIEARAKHAATRRVAYWKVSRTREQDLIGGWNKRVP